MARRTRVQEERRPAGRGERRRVPRWQVDRKRQRMAFAVGAVAILFIVALPLWGYITTFVLPPRQVVAQVNDATITLGDLLKNLRIAQKGAEVSGIPLDLSTQPFNTLDILVESEVLRQMAGQLEVSASPEEIDQAIRSRISGPPQADEEREPAALEAEFRERLRQYLNLLQISEGEYQERVRVDLLRERAMEVVGREVDPIQPQIHLFQLSVADDETLARVQELAEEGTPFEELVEEYEINEASKEIGGEIGWLPRGLLGPQGDQFFELEVETLSDPARSPEGIITLFMVKEKAEAKEVQEDHLAQLRRDALDEWFQETRREQDIETTFGSPEYDWLVKQLRVSTRSQ